MLIWILAIFLALVFTASAAMKLLGLSYSMRNRERFGMSMALWRVIGLLELAGVAGVLIGIALPALGIAAGIGLAMLMAGAIATRLRVHDPAVQMLGDLIVLALVIVFVVVRS